MNNTDVPLYYGYCTCNDDRMSRAVWPKFFAKFPEVGERVESQCGQYIRWVVGITHKYFHPDAPPRYEGHKQHMFELELGRFENVPRK